MNTPFEKRICFTVCICQMTAVLSCVSVVYLTVAIYKPAYLTLSSGFIEEPVMCTTIANVTPTDCDEAHGPGDREKWKGWNSCSEWCLSKASSSCPRIMVDARWNGTGIRLEGCESIEKKFCAGIDPDKPPLACVEGSCQGISGLFNCTTPVPIPGTSSDLSYGAKCRDLSSILECNITNAPEMSSCEKPTGCLKLNGTYTCVVGKCYKVLPPFNCKKKCIGIQTGNKSVIIREGDKIFSAQCLRAVNISTGEELWPLNYKSLTDPETPKTLLMFCTNMFVSPTDNRSYVMSDCFNGTLLEPNHFGNSTDIVQLLETHIESVNEGTDGGGVGLVGPTELELRIINNTRLFINFESCVNTLILNECEKFYAEYGGDGTDLRSQSRYQCFYNPDDKDFVALRFNRMKTLTELMLATSIPITLAFVSCFTLIICSRIIRVGDDSHFYFQCCGDDSQAVLEKDHVEAMAL